MNTRPIFRKSALAAAAVLSLMAMHAAAENEAFNIPYAPAHSDDQAGFSLAEPAQSAQTIGLTPTETGNSRGAVQIKADIAQAMGATGKGVTVAVIDTGVMTNHPDLSGRVLAGYNFVANNTNATDDNGHGTHVAGIIGASRNGAGMVGVAPEVSILPVKVLSASGSGYGSWVANGINYSVGKSRVINLSLGSSSIDSYIQAALQNAVSKGMLVAAAAGNNGGANPIWPARFAKETWANGQIIAVGAVDAANNIASFSNRAGDTKNFFLVAPGTSILSTYKTGGYAYMSGTSMATPFVAGAAASIMSYWPYLKANQVSSILFKTATDLGAPGVDAVYGWGLVNLEKALQPVGATTVTSANGSKTTSLGTSSAVLSGAARNTTRPLNVTAFDDYGRGYQYTLSQPVTRQPDAYSLSSLMDVVNAPQMFSVQLDKNTWASFSRPQKLNLGSELSSAPLPGQQPGMAYATAFGDYQLSFSSGLQPGMFFGFNQMETAKTAGMLTAVNFSSPYYKLMDGGSHAKAGLRLSGDTTLQFGQIQSRNLSAWGGANDINPAMPWLSGAAPVKNAVVVELTSRYDRGAVGISASSLKETDGLLGGVQSGLFSLGSEAGTMSYNLSGFHRITRSASFAWSASVGRTTARDGDFYGISPVVTTAYSAGVIAGDVFRSGDKLAFGVSQPLAVVSGSMSSTIPTSFDDNGNPVFTRETSSLAPTKRERDFEVSYRMALNRNANVTYGALARLNPGHDETLPMDKVVMVKYGASF